MSYRSDDKDMLDVLYDEARDEFKYVYSGLTHEKKLQFWNMCLEQTAFNLGLDSDVGVVLLLDALIGE